MSSRELHRRADQLYGAASYQRRIGNDAAADWLVGRARRVRQDAETAGTRQPVGALVHPAPSVKRQAGHDRGALAPVHSPIHAVTDGQRAGRDRHEQQLAEDRLAQSLAERLRLSEDPAMIDPCGWLPGRFPHIDTEGRDRFWSSRFPPFRAATVGH